MSTNITLGELPIPIRKLANKRYKECDKLIGQKHINNDEDSLIKAFIWDLTPEGHEFWAYICKRDFTLFKKLHPRTKL